MIKITNGHGGFPNHEHDREPEPASVILTDGEYGNAWQRYFSDGLWHRGKQAITWEQVLRFRNVVLVYDAPPRDRKSTVDGKEITWIGVSTGRIER